LAGVIKAITLSSGFSKVVIGQLHRPALPVAGSKTVATINSDVRYCKVGPDGWLYYASLYACKIFKGKFAL
jgi:hypothetical protein